MKYELPDPAEWDFRSVPEIELDQVITYEYARESVRLREKIQAGDIDGDWSWDLFILTQDYPEYPKPYLRMTQKPTPWKPSHELEIRSLDDSKGTRWQYVMRVPFGKIRIKDAVQQFEKWLSAESRKIGRKKKGNGSAAPWVKLKQLAALRLSRVMPLREMKQAMDEVRKGGNYVDVLPNYTSPDKAIENAQKIAKEIEAQFLPEIPP